MDRSLIQIKLQSSNNINYYVRFRYPADILQYTTLYMQEHSWSSWLACERRIKSLHYIGLILLLSIHAYAIHNTMPYRYLYVCGRSVMA